MIDKFATQFIRIFSKPVPMPIIGDDGAIADEEPVAFMTDREFDRRVRWHAKQAELHAEVDAARRRWQDLERQAMLAKFDYIDAYSKVDPDLITRHETGRA